jgi:hypothetical protein
MFSKFSKRTIRATQNNYEQHMKIDYGFQYFFEDRFHVDVIFLLWLQASGYKLQANSFYQST